MTKKRLRILFNTNAIWAPSGYGQQAAEILPRIQKLGYPLAVVNFYGQEGGSFMLDGIKQYPKMVHQWGGDAMAAHGRDFRTDVTFTLQDIWVLEPQHIESTKRWIPIVPIDHLPTPPAIVERLRNSYRIVTYSPYGREQLKREGLHSTYIQHTVDTKLFKPRNKNKIRRDLGIPTDIFLFGMVAANKENPPRKCFQEVMDAFKKFQEKHPKSGIYFHVIVDMQGGFPITQYAKHIGIADKVFTIPVYDLIYKVPKKDMGKIYSMMDCLLMPSLNEGFGVPAIEAQACGVPAIVNDFTAMPHLIKDGVTGYKTKVAYKRFTNLLSYVGVPDWRDIEEKMHKVYNADRGKMSKDAREWVVGEFDTDIVFENKWKPFLSQLESEVYPTKNLT